MKTKSLLLFMLMALFAPWAANAQNSIPFNEGFESMTSVDDLTAAGWTLSTTESGTFLAIETSTSNVYEGTKSLNLDAWNASSSSSVQYLGLPLVAGDLNTLQISFAYKVSSGTINVGYLTDATDFSTFTSLAQYNSSSSFTVVSTDLSEAPSDAARLVLKYTGWFRCYLDSFEVKVLPSCQAATSITASDITTTSATIAWEGEGNTWNLKYNGIEVNGISAMSYNLTNLTDNTNYTVSVQNVCSDGTTTDWISTTFSTLEVCPDGMVCIGSGTTTSTYLPANNYYNYSLSQQIYTADEIGEAGAILSIDFFKAATTAMAVDLDIYMVLTEKVEFDSLTDFIPVTASNLVYSGTVTFANNAWTTIELDVPFVYDGQSNVAIMVDNNTGGYVSSTPFYVFNSDKNQALYAQSDGTNFDPFAPSFSYRTAQKNRIRLVVGEPPACPKPTGLAVDYQGGTEATISWTSDATAWNMRVNGTPIYGTITNPYTLTGLELATTYEVEVQANCGSDLSEWAGPVSFSTDACMPEDQIVVNYTLTDSYSDGWNGNYILVVDENCNIVNQLTIESGNSATGTLKVCGSYVQFLWYKGSYPAETSWVFTDNAGNVLFEGAGSADMATLDVLYTIDSNPYSAPTDVAASEVGPHSAKLSWTETGTATAWQILLTAGDDEEGTIIDANSNPFVITGLTPETEYFAQVRATGANGTSIWTCLGADFTTLVPCPAPTALEVVPTPISATVTWTGYASNYILRYGTCAEPDPTQPATIIFHADDVWQDGSGYQMLLDADATAFGTIIPETGGLTSAGDATDDVYAEFEYKIPANADGSCTTSNVVIDNTITLQIPAGTYDWCITNPTPGDRIWIASGQGNIGGRADDYVFEGGMTYEFHMYLLGSNDATDVTIMCSNVDWTYVDNATSPYTINGLDPETEYTVGVQAVCGGEDGESAWTSTNFTTPSNCDAPSALNVTNLLPTTATLNWTGYQEEGFEVRYRPTAEGSELLNEDFENGLTWTTIDADGDGFNWDLHVNTGTGNHATHSGDGVMTSASYDNDASVPLTPDNYLVSPRIELGGSITFWACAQDGAWPTEHFGVAVSTTSNTDASTFTTIQEWTMTAKKSASDCKSIYDNGNYLKKNRGNRAEGAWYSYTVDLSAYAGQAGYVAIRHFNCTDMFYLNVDDITINGPAPEEQEWIMASTDATSYAAEGLEPETAYEWQVRGVNNSCTNGEDEGYTAWSEMGNFTTPEITTLTQTITLGEASTWFSTYVDITLDDLKAALVAALPANTTIKIKNADEILTYSRGRWNGSLTWDVAKMYKIIVPTTVTLPIEFTLEGMPLDPSEHTITIAGSGRATWIGFPFSENMTPTNAFAVIAQNGDKVKSSSGNTSYTRGRWQGEFPLEPGKGYIFISNANATDRTLVYPTSSKAVKK